MTTIQKYINTLCGKNTELQTSHSPILSSKWYLTPLKEFFSIPMPLSALRTKYSPQYPIPQPRSTYMSVFSCTVRFTQTVQVPDLVLTLSNILVFDVLLTVHLSIFISVFNQIDAQNLFHNKFYFMPLHVSSTCAHHQEVKITLHSLWYHHTYRCNDTRGCVMQFWPPDDEHMCSKHVEAWNKTYCETNFVHQVG